MSFYDTISGGFGDGGPTMPHVQDLYDGSAYGSDGSWSPCVNGCFEQGRFGRSDAGQYRATRPKKHKPTFHQRSRRAIQTGRDAYDVMVSWFPVGYAVGFIGLMAHGVYEIFAGNPAQGGAELVSGTGFLSQVRKVKKWSEAELEARKKKKVVRMVSRKLKVPVDEVKKIVGSNKDVLNNLAAQVAYEGNDFSE